MMERCERRRREQVRRSVRPERFASLASGFGSWFPICDTARKWRIMAFRYDHVHGLAFGYSRDARPVYRDSHSYSSTKLLGNPHGGLPPARPRSGRRALQRWRGRQDPGAAAPGPCAPLERCARPRAPPSPLSLVSREVMKSSKCSVPVRGRASPICLGRSTYAPDAVTRSVAVHGPSPTEAQRAF
jgi:hypothetical protein